MATAPAPSFRAAVTGLSHAGEIGPFVKVAFIETAAPSAR